MAVPGLPPLPSGYTGINLEVQVSLSTSAVHLLPVSSGKGPPSVQLQYGMLDHRLETAGRTYVLDLGTLSVLTRSTVSLVTSPKLSVDAGSAELVPGQWSDVSFRVELQPVLVQVRLVWSHLAAGPNDVKSVPLPNQQAASGIGVAMSVVRDEEHDWPAPADEEPQLLWLDDGVLRLVLWIGLTIRLQPQRWLAKPLGTTLDNELGNDITLTLLQEDAFYPEDRSLSDALPTIDTQAMVDASLYCVELREEVAGPQGRFPNDQFHSIAYRRGDECTVSLILEGLGSQAQLDPLFHGYHPDTSSVAGPRSDRLGRLYLQITTCGLLGDETASVTVNGVTVWSLDDVRGQGEVGCIHMVVVNVPGDAGEAGVVQNAVGVHWASRAPGKGEQLASGEGLLIYWQAVEDSGYFGIQVTYVVILAVIGVFAYVTQRVVYVLNSRRAQQQEDLRRSVLEEAPLPRPQRAPPEADRSLRGTPEDVFKSFPTFTVTETMLPGGRKQSMGPRGPVLPAAHITPVLPGLAPPQEACSSLKLERSPSEDKDPVEDAEPDLVPSAQAGQRGSGKQGIFRRMSRQTHQTAEREVASPRRWFNLGSRLGSRQTEEASTEGNSCSICLCEYELDETLVGLPCKHVFHMECLQEWLGRSHYCPICRQDLLPARTPQEEQSSSPTLPHRMLA